MDDTCSPGQTCTETVLCFKHKIRTLRFGTGVARQSRTLEGRNPHTGERFKATKDEATTRGNVITEHATRDDRVDVLIRPDTPKYGFGRTN